MNTRMVATLALTASVVVLLSVGCATPAADASGTSLIGLARGRVVNEDLLRADRSTSVRAEARSWSAEALREFHGASRPAASPPGGRTGWSAEALREFHGASGQAASVPEGRVGWSADALREFHGVDPQIAPESESRANWSDEVVRELKDGAADEVGAR